MLRYDHASQSAAETAANSLANSLVLRALDADRSADDAPRGDRSGDAQELPSLRLSLDLVGAAIARAARIAAAEDRARLHFPTILASQAAGLLKASPREMRALFADHDQAGDAGEGTLVPGTSGTKSVVWRLHPAPATAGAALANRTTDTCGVPA
jgi:hypothetical protein